MATPAEAGASQNDNLDSGSRGAAHPAAPSRMDPGATDDEILGLTTNVRRRDSTASHGPTGAESREANGQERDSAAEQRGASDGKESSASARSGSQSAAKAAEGTT